MPPPPEADRCPQSKGGSQWVQHQDQCYAFRVTSPKSNVHNMEEAERICQGMGELWMGVGWGGWSSSGVRSGPALTLLLCLCFLLTEAHVLTIKSTEENNFVSKYLHNDPLITTRAWLGMNVDSHGEPVEDPRGPTGNASTPVRSRTFSPRLEGLG